MLVEYLPGVWGGVDCSKQTVELGVTLISLSVSVPLDVVVRLWCISELLG